MTQSLRAEYEVIRPHLERLKDEALFVIQDAVDREGIKIHATHARIKDFASAQKKLARLEQSGSDGTSLFALNDLVGLRIVCLFLSDIPRLGTSLRSCLNVIHEDNKIDGAEVSSFGYQSVHFVCQFPSGFSGPRYDPLKGKSFEVQVRTIAMDAWAAASHYLDYKNEQGVPLNLRKDFYALSGLFYVADTHFEMFYKEVVQSRERLRSLSPSISLLDRELDLDTLSQYLREALPDRKRSDNKGISELLDELLAANYKHISDIDSQLKIAMDVFLAYESSNPPSVSDDDEEDQDVTSKFSDVGVIRVLLEIADDDFLNLRMQRESLSASWAERLTKYKRMLNSAT